MKKSFLLLTTILLFTAAAAAQSDADKAAINATALNYAEGWYEGNGDRMESALHPDLAKRMIGTDAKGRSVFNHMSAMTLVQVTRRGYGKETPVAEQRKDVKILDTYENVAMVRLDMRDWVDFLQMAKVDGKWKIVNVLWEPRPKK